LRSETSDPLVVLCREPSQEIAVTKDPLGDHGFLASEEVFAFGSSTAPATKAGPVIEQEARPVANAVQANKKTLSAKVVRITAQKAGPLAKLAQAGARKPGPATAAPNSIPPTAAAAAKETARPAAPASAAKPPIEVDAPKTAAPVPAQAASQTPPAVKVGPTAAPREVNPPRALEVTAQVLRESSRPPGLPKFLHPGKDLKTAAELAAVIEEVLAQHPDSPKQGLRVTVYGGGADWRAMLTFLPAAGGVRNAQQLRELTDHLAEDLRQRYRLAWS
jgi:hypothetical protein